MANQQKGTNQADKSKRQPPPAAVDEDMSEQDQRDMKRTQDQSQQANEDTDGNPDQVEIGDPVPEDDQTIKARRTSETGETGEDEDLPDDDGSIETARTPDERH